MLIKNLALVSITGKLKAAELSQTAAALQKQIVRDLGPIWGIHATINYFPDLESVPFGYWPIIIIETGRSLGVGGYHTSKLNQPFALVILDDAWQLHCSHEVCEILVDPYGNRLAPAASLIEGEGKVNYLVEVCDPCEGADNAYTINGILVSDFYTPQYFDPQSIKGLRYSFTGALEKPLDILKNGYISWHDPILKKWQQATFFGDGIIIKDLGGIKDFGDNLRSQVDRLTINPSLKDCFIDAQQKNSDFQRKVLEAGESMSKEWLKEIARVINPPKVESTEPPATVAAINSTANIYVDFISGPGQVIIIINNDSKLISNSSSVEFENVNQGDLIKIDGVCIGTATITIDLPTSAGTPLKFNPGCIHEAFVVL